MTLVEYGTPDLLSAIREYDAKQLVSYWLTRSPTPVPVASDSLIAPVRVAQVQW